MSQPQEPGEAQSGPLQFDRAEFAEEPQGGPYCRVCREPLRDVYYDVGGDVVCPSCVEKRARPGSRLGRGLKALLFGSAAAAVGAAIYRMIRVATGGWHFSLVAILVGYMVGGAVRTGSGERGGRLYQILAVFLTYSALVGMYLPDIWGAFAAGPKAAEGRGKAVEKGPREGVKADPGRKADTKPAEDAARPRAEARPAAAVVKPAPEAKPKAGLAAPEAKERPEDVGGDGRPPSVLYLLYLLGMLLLMLLLMIGWIYCIPFFVGFHSPILLLIFGFALWQAWITTRASELPVTGPYRVRR